MSQKYGIDWNDIADNKLDKKVTGKADGNMSIEKGLMKQLIKVAKEIKMDDWDLRLSYNPKPDGDATMEVDTTKTEYNIATITVFKIRTDAMMEECFLHELFHARIGTLLKHYVNIIDNQNELIQELGNLHEERLMEELVGVVRKKRVFDNDEG